MWCGTRPRPFSSAAPDDRLSYATFRLDDAELNAIREITAGGEPVDRLYHVDLVDAAGVVHASVEKTIYIRRREESSRRSR
jgi:hypothetical protein